MNELVTLMRNDAVVSSLQIAEHFGKRHDRVLRAIENALTTDPKNGVSDSPFRKSSYKDESGKKNTMYYLTRDGFSFVVMGFTGKKAAERGRRGGGSCLIEFLAGLSCLAFVGCVCYVFYMIAEEQKEDWGE